MPEFLLQLDTDKVEFTSEKLGEDTCTSVVKIKNTQKEKYLYKIKCTSNELFRIRPPLGYIKPGEAEAVKLIFNSGKPVPESGKHYFVVYYRKADGDKAPRNAWQGKEPEAMKRLYINFSKKKEEKEEKKEEKKEEEKKEEKKEEEKKEEEKKEEKKEEEKKEEKKEEEKKEEKKEEEKKEEKKEEEKKEEKKEEEKKEEKKEEEKKEEKKEEEKKEEKKEEEKKE